MKVNVRNLVLSALFVALGVVLPIAFHVIPGGGQVFSPMHIPVLLCGFVCGWPYGLMVGAVTPILSSLLTQMPPMGSPYLIAMIPELAAYGLLAGLCYKLLPRTMINLCVALAVSMLGGRIVWGLTMWALTGTSYTMNAFLTSAFISAWPAIALHIVLIPLLIAALQRAKLMPEARAQ